jgi:hypothetical protein
MKRNVKNIMLFAGLLVLSVILYSCGGGSSYGGGGGGGTAAPGAFSLLIPADNVTGVGTTPTLTWTPATDASDYRVQIDTSGTFAGTLLVNAVENSSTYSYTVSSGTLTTGPYHWRVVAENAYGQSIAGPRTITP